MLFSSQRLLLTKKVKIVIGVALILILSTSIGLARNNYAQDDLSRAASGVIYYDEEIDPIDDERAEIEVELRDGDGREIEDDVFFYVEASRGIGDMELYYHDEYNDYVEEVEDNIWIVETDHRHSNFDGRYISLWVESDIKGDIDFYIGKRVSDGLVRDLFTGSEYGGEITISILEYDAEYYEINVPDKPQKAGSNYDVGITVRETDSRSPRVRDAEVTFYERKDGGDWEEIGTEETDREGEAEVSVRHNNSGRYEYTAEVAEAEKEDDISGVSVTAADPSELEALEDERTISQREERIYFRMTDRYDNINKDIEHGVAEHEDYRTRDLEDFDYTERLEVTVEDPEGDTTIYEYDDIGYSEDREAMYAEIDFDEYGDWEVEGRVTGTGITATTIVDVAEFGGLEDMRIEFDNQMMREFDGGFDYYEDDVANVILIDEDGVEIEYDTRDRDILFSSSSTSIVSIDTRKGELNPKRTGEVEIEAYHEEEDIEVSEMLYLSGEPEEIEVEVDKQEGDLTGKVTITMVDEDGIRALPGEFETYTENDTGYPEEFIEDGEYELVVPDGITVEDKEDFEAGVASFSIEADDYGEYRFRVYTDYGPSKTFYVEFEEGRKTVVLNIGSRDFTIDGDLYEFEEGVEPFIEEDRTYLPVRATMEAFDARVIYDAVNRSITVETDEERLVAFYLDEKEYYVDGDSREMDVVPYLDEDTERSYLPIRYLAEEALDAEVGWDEDEQEVTISY